LRRQAHLLPLLIAPEQPLVLATSFPPLHRQPLANAEVHPLMIAPVRTAAAVVRRKMRKVKGVMRIVGELMGIGMITMRMMRMIKKRMRMSTMRMRKPPMMQEKASIQFKFYHTGDLMTFLSSYYFSSG
jgi:hypothetical protein